MKDLIKNNTPLFKVLKEYACSNTTPFHVPGHKKGTGIFKEFKEFLGENVFKIDVTTFDLVDSLQNPVGAIKEAESLTAQTYGADKSFFSVQGTSGAIEAMILSCVKDGDKILIPRNVHKSITAALILSRAIPIYMEPDIDIHLGIAHGISYSVIEKHLQETPDIKAVLIINPTYYGVATDIKSIASLVHKYNIPLLVDEAHGPHLSFSPDLPTSAIEAGADICCQSTHKILGSLTQSSLIHIKSNLIDSSHVKQVLNLLQTTSPSYLLMASLDCSRMQMDESGTELISKTLNLCSNARKKINEIPGFYCFGKEILNSKGAYALDETKLTICCRELGLSGYQLYNLLSSKYNIQLELSDFYNVLAVGSLGDTEESFYNLIYALTDISTNYYGLNPPITNTFKIPPMPPKILEPSTAFNALKKTILLNNSLNEICGELIMAYPPGIPLIAPGEIITKDILDYINNLKSSKLHIQGTEDANVNFIKCISKK